MTVARRLLLLTGLLLAGSAPRGGDAAGENATTVPMPPYRPLAGVAVPADIPEKSRVLMHDEIWEMPDTVRIAIGLGAVWNFYETTRIVQETIFTGRDAGDVASWHDFHNDANQRLESFEGEIRFPDGRRVPLTRSEHLLEKKIVMSQESSKWEASGESGKKPHDRLEWLVIPGAPPGAVIEFRAVMHYELMPHLNRCFVDGPLPVDHFRLRIRSNRSLYVRKRDRKLDPKADGGIGVLTLSREKQKEFNPRGKEGLWRRSHERWWADELVLPRGGTLRAGAATGGEDVHESEFLADSVPAHEHEPLQPDDDTVRPLVLAYYSSSAPSEGLGYWQSGYPERYQKRLKDFLDDMPDARELNLPAVLGGAVEPGQKAKAAAEWVRGKFHAGNFRKLLPFRETLRNMRGSWEDSLMVFAAVLRASGVTADLAIIFSADDLPVTPELTDDQFYSGPFLAVRVELPGGPEYYFPNRLDLSDARVPARYRGAESFYFWKTGEARRELVPFTRRPEEGEQWRLSGAIEPDGKIAARAEAEFTGRIATNVRAQVGDGLPEAGEAPADSAPAPAAAAGAEEGAVSAGAATLLRARLGGVPEEIRVEPYRGGYAPVRLRGRWSKPSDSVGNFPALVNPLELHPFFKKAARRYPVRDYAPVTHRLDFSLALPAGRRPAQARLEEKIEGPGGFSFAAKAEFAEGRWTGFWELRETEREVPVADYTALRDAEQKTFELLQRGMPLVPEKPAVVPAAPDRRPGPRKP